MTVPTRILPVIIFSQFAGTSLWFAVNAVIGDLQSAMNVDISHTGIVTSATQFGFISGTMIFSLLALSDRYSPKKLFLACSFLGAVSNLMIYIAAYDLFSLLTLRFITGFFLTGIYPVGMKIAAGWYKKDLGNAMGMLVGALVLGTAFPHFLKSIGGSYPWGEVILYVSLVAFSGGVMMYFLVPDGPYITSGSNLKVKDVFKIFHIREFRSAAFGYFGHMWELYTFWALVPVMLIFYGRTHQIDFNLFFWSFIIIALGSLGCILGGIISKVHGSAPVALVQLGLSGLCCILSPFFFSMPMPVFLSFLILWGIVVVGDSPQYTSIAALSAPKELIGTGLTFMVSIGFTITILSLWFVYQFTEILEVPYLLVLLAPGPIAGIIMLLPLLKKINSNSNVGYTK